VLIVGTITAFSMGLLGLVMNDIKRVVAYSTLSQLGYMAVALGASAYAAGIFHLFTHAFFKALLFLAAGSVIIALHHEQDMRRMGGLRKHMPITYWTALIGALALAGIPPFAGFFSKDAIIEAVHLSSTPGHGIAYVAVLSGVFITALYTFRMLFMTFHGKERFAPHAEAGHGEHGHGAHTGPPHESPWVVTVPLIALAIPSVYAGWAYVEPLLFGGFFGGMFGTGGAVFAMYYTSRIPDPSRMRATMSAVFVVSTAVRLLLFLVSRLLLQREVWLAFAALVPLVLIGFFVGHRLHGRLTPLQVARFISVLLVFSGTSVLVKGLA